jgi:TolB-like protein/tetratricopeptide (TPR) repeat protein/tRNA A-37 threonylcarbamoyl transferase component Bud32
LPDLQGQLTVTLQGQYAIQREIGHGGMAVVYLARDLKHDRDVALKVLHPHLAELLGRERFLREIRVAAQLHHPHLLPLYDSGDADGSLYYVVPYVEGGSLRDRLSREPPLDAQTALQITREVAEALDYAHRHKVIHRDIKPDNILLDEGHAVIADFGVARAITEAVDTQLTETGLLVGTPEYMSPEEVAEEPVDGRSDIYGLACVLFELLTGKTPFSGKNPLSMLARRLTETAPRLKDRGIAAPPRLEQALACALARSPEERFSTAGEFAQELAAVAGEITSPLGSASSGLSSPGTRVSATPERHAVAVLPFINLSGSRENDYFGDGMTEEIINALMQVKGLRVAARTSCFAFRGKDLDAQTIARGLKVNSLVEGSIRKAGNRIRLTAQLVDAADGYQRWSQTYERTMDDVFALQEELARAIVRELPLGIAEPTDSRLVKPATENLEAYTLYMRGRYFANKRTPDGLRSATDYFEQAVALDPSSGPAYSGLAACLSLRGFEEFGDLPPCDAMPKAKAAALRAMEIDPASTEAHLWLGVVAMLFDWNREAAELQLRKAAESGANPIAQLWYAVFLASGKRYQESVAVVLRAQALDPLSLPVHQTVARCYAWAGEYEKALNQLRATQQMEPHHPLTYAWFGRVFLGMGRLQDALTQVQKGMEVAGRLPLLLQLAGCALGRLGKHREAGEILVELQQLSTRQYVSPTYQAYVLGAMGEMDEAFRMFDCAVEQRSGLLALAHVTHESAVPALRSDPRFASLLKKVGLEGSAT